MEKIPLNQSSKPEANGHGNGDASSEPVDAQTGPLRRHWGADWASFVALKLDKMGVSITEAEALSFPVSRWKKALWALEWIPMLLTYSHVNFIVAHGNKTLLKETDFPPVQEHETASRLSNLLTDEWERERKKPNPNVVNVIFRVYWPKLLLVIMLGAVYSACRILEALLIGALVRVFQDSSKSNNEGYMWAGLLTLAVMLDSTCRGYMFYWAVRTGFNMRVGMISTIYRKTLNLSMSHASSTGTIVNLVSNDVQRFEDAAPFATFVVSAPIEALVILAILWSYIGVASLAGFAAIFGIIPIQAFFSRTFARLRTYVVGWRDDRIRNTSDVLLGMNVVKLYAWEEPFRAKLQSLRDSEMLYLTRSSLMRAINDTSFIASPAMVGIATWVTYWALGNELDSSKIFIALSLFNITRQSMTGSLPKAIQFLSESMISINRIQEFLSLPEMHEETEAPPSDIEKPSSSALVTVRNATFAWNTNTGSFGKSLLENLEDKKSGKNRTANGGVKNDNPASSLAPPSAPNHHQTNGVGLKTTSSREEGSDLKVILKDVDLNLSRGKLVCVVGPVGAGKTSLIMGILNEMVRTTGTVQFHSSKVAYCPQAPWIVSGSVRDNVLFGYEYDDARFKDTIEMCAMTRDLEIFADGADSLIGERGVTLSGGQKARCSLARAIYYDADIYLLDDVLSAVDPKVGRHLFEKCITELKNRGKAVLLITHQLNWVRHADEILVLEHGSISKRGSWKDVISGDAEGFVEVLREYQNKDSVDDEIDDESPPEGVKHIGKATDRPLHADLREDTKKQKEFVAEDRAIGTVGGDIYWGWFKEGGGLFFVVGLMGLLSGGEAMRVLADWWLSHWTNLTGDEQRSSRQPIIYGIIVAVLIVVVTIRGQFFYVMSLRASNNLSRKMLASVLRAPLWFFQVNPHGRLLNRFSKDLALVDELLPLTFIDFLQCAFIIVGTLVLACTVIPWVTLAVPFLGAIFWYLRKIYMTTSRQVKRLESTTRSPVYSNVPATLEGLSVIRAFRSQERFRRRFYSLQDENTTIFYCWMSCARWVGWRLDLACAVFLGVVAFLSVGLRGSLSPGFLGLLLTYVMGLVGLNQWAVRQSTEVENLMVSVERVLEYTNLPEEPPAVTDLQPPKNWPDKGNIEISQMSLTYPVTKSTVLKDITVRFEPSEKIGLVGRTGAGKSSFLTALFRLVEFDGSIKVDGLETKHLGLRDLRTSLSIIPQEPFLFKGTLRFNIDPFNKYSDADLWRALDAVELKEKVAGFPEKLDSPVADGGANWSVGERQLICLARAILRDSRLIVMDEATANIDLKTDRLIQQSIRSEAGLFSNATVVTIAHRLNTVIDYDKIMVLDQGRLVEFGRPHELLQNQDGWLARMVHDMGPEAEQMLKEIAASKEEERMVVAIPTRPTKSRRGSSALVMSLLELTKSKSSRSFTGDLTVLPDMRIEKAEAEIDNDGRDGAKQRLTDLPPRENATDVNKVVQDTERLAITGARFESATSLQSP
ncbi:hypothetical protein M427DRAFT_128884 [Gonapodya prolifera JEL478]|uniref:P-loop containing nucleoside triphosphate hydrolase protein n=1 Tax=Gonapodya prolifera (strain JEL478) TaxID=1344416 RepID=A0A138ZYD1_GONPJ|nr:hypothetical protein M427DRAFT_128884 [Gonapodya prolifera JEL478]|eukprot:KXS09504.1 hypothetical protein M427DRAFT_128884 [Gonapodya prolifera JEL478]